MAHIERRQQPRADGTLGPVRYRVRYLGLDGRERSKSFIKKADASRFAARQETKKAEGTWVDPAAGLMRLGEYADQFVAGKLDLKPKTRASYESLLETCIKPTLGHFNLSAVTAEVVDDWVVGLLSRKPKGLSPSRTRQAYNLLGAIFKKAVRKRLVIKSPCELERGELPRLTHTAPRYLTVAEVKRLSDSMESPYEVLVLVLACTGIRFGEAAALRRGRCDILHARLLIAESLGEVNGHLTFGETKTHQQRNVVLPEFLLTAFEDHLSTAVGEGSDSLVFTGPDGGPLRYSNFRSRHWLPAVKRAHLEPLHIHALRHSFASLAASSGATVKLVQTQLGHKDPALTLRVYQHLFPDDLDPLAARMDEAFRRVTTQEIARPGRGLELVRADKSSNEEGSTWTNFAPPVGLEPTTHGLGNRRSIL